MQYCPNCGKEIPADSIRCPVCRVLIQAVSSSSMELTWSPYDRNPYHKRVQMTAPPTYSFKPKSKPQPLRLGAVAARKHLTLFTIRSPTKTGEQYTDKRTGIRYKRSRGALGGYYVLHKRPDGTYGKITDGPIRMVNSAVCPFCKATVPAIDICLNCKRRLELMNR